MANRHINRSQRRRIRQRRNLLAIGAMALIAVILTVAVILILRPHGDAPAPAATPTNTPAPTAQATAVATATATAEPTPEVTSTPTPAPTFEPGEIPNVLSFYRPKGKSYSPRVRLGDEYAAKWKKGEDIGSFEVIASEEARLEGDFFGDIFGGCWTRYADADKCKIGFTLRYTLEDGGEVKYTMLSPDHIQHTEYIECWLYDDYHREPHKSYSHIKKMKDDTLITSIKLTCGRKIKEVSEIWLTAFICTSADEFDADQNYTGPTYCTLHITRA